MAVAHVKSGFSVLEVTVEYTPVATGNLIVVMCTDATRTSLTLSSPGYSWNVLIPHISTTGTNSFAWWAFAPNTNPATFTVSTNGSWNNIMVDEFSGVDTISPISAVNDAVGNSNSPSVSVTPLHNDCMLWGGVVDSITGLGSGYTKGVDDGGQDWTEYKSISGGSGTPQTINFTGGGGTWLIFGAAIRPAVTMATEQEGFRFRNDDGDETTATWIVAQDANATPANGVPTRLRILINTTGDIPNTNYQLEFKKSTDSVWELVRT